jgi:prepilin-type N-terminal cleavage/methylation domain-containing protein
MQRQKGFTLVELLIVIALIAILSVGVLATINPVEQRNKAVDANISNDAGEVLNAYERYYANNSAYPWMVVDTTNYKVDTVFYAVSNQVGFGLCTNTTLGTDKVHTNCSAYNASGALISSDELKASFLNKKYGMQSADVGYDTNKLLYLVKFGSSSNNSLYVCYIPNAKANRTKTNNLKKLSVSADTGIPTGMVDADTDGDDSDFDTSGSPKSTWTFATPQTSLFKCVP